MHKKVTKAVIPAAGFGTRFLPITKSVCKEMLPIADKPTIQYIVEEAVAAGIKDILIVTGKGKKILEDYFDSAPELEELLEREQKQELLRLCRSTEGLANIHYIRQSHATGFADAILLAETFTGDDPFAILLGDDVIYTSPASRPAIGQLIDCYEETELPTVAVMRVSDEDVPKYANIRAQNIAQGRYMIEQIVEKPAVKDKFSDLAVIGRYVVGKDIYEMIRKTEPSARGEVYFTDALGKYARQGKLLGCLFKGRRYDAGNKLEYLEANIEFALRDKNLSAGLEQYLISLVDTIKGRS